MTTFPNSPRLIKGAIIGQDPFNPVANYHVSIQPGNVDADLAAARCR